jgi:PAS domain S-box-containing protein
MSNQIPQNNSFALDTREDLVINAIEIFDTIKQSLVVLNKELIVVMANASFYKTFEVTREETEGTQIYDIGNGQWNIGKLKVLLEDIIPKNKAVNDYEVTHNFEHIGEKVMLLNAREILRQDNRQEVILVAIEDITFSKQLERQTKEAEANINSILEDLVGSSMRFSGGTAPQPKEKKPKKP